MLIRIALLLAAAGAAAPPQVQDLGAWRVLGPVAWTDDAGGVAAGPSDRAGFLVSPEEYGDFVLSVEFWIDERTNSGIFIRCADAETVEQLTPFDCYEVNIYDQHPQQENRTGAVVLVVQPLVRVDTAGRWNTLDIKADGANVEVRVNGVRTAVLEDARTGAGPMALQYGGPGLVRFRKLRVEAIN